MSNEADSVLTDPATDMECWITLDENVSVKGDEGWIRLNDSIEQSNEEARVKCDSVTTVPLPLTSKIGTHKTPRMKTYESNSMYSDYMEYDPYIINTTFSDASSSGRYPVYRYNHNFLRADPGISTHDLLMLQSYRANMNRRRRY